MFVKKDYPVIKQAGGGIVMYDKYISHVCVFSPPVAASHASLATYGRWVSRISRVPSENIHPSMLLTNKAFGTI